MNSTDDCDCHWLEMRPGFYRDREVRDGKPWCHCFITFTEKSRGRQDMSKNKRRFQLSILKQQRENEKTGKQKNPALTDTRLI